MFFYLLWRNKVFLISFGALCGGTNALLQSHSYPIFFYLICASSTSHPFSLFSFPFFFPGVVYCLTNKAESMHLTSTGVEVQLHLRHAAPSRFSCAILLQNAIRITPKVPPSAASVCLRIWSNWIRFLHREQHRRIRSAAMCDVASSDELKPALSVHIISSYPSPRGLGRKLVVGNTRISPHCTLCRGTSRHQPSLQSF